MRGKKVVKREQRWTKNRAGRAIRCSEYLINLLAWMYLIPRRRVDTRAFKGPAKSRGNSYHLVNPQWGVATFLTPPSRRRCHRPGVTTWAFLRTSGCCLSFRVKRKAITTAKKEEWWRRGLQCAWLICWRFQPLRDRCVRYNRTYSQSGIHNLKNLNILCISKLYKFTLDRYMYITENFYYF